MRTTVLGRTFTIRHGRCAKTPGSLTLDLGEIVLGQTSKKKPDYVGLTVGREAVGTGPAAGKGDPLRAGATITLAHGRSRGTFAATSLDGGAVTGSFHC